MFGSFCTCVPSQTFKAQLLSKVSHEPLLPGPSFSATGLTVTGESLEDDVPTAAKENGGNEGERGGMGGRGEEYNMHVTF